jgi:hypothetical protein
MRQKLGSDTGSGELKQGEVEPLVVQDSEMQGPEIEFAEYDLSVEFSQYVVDGVYCRYQETPGQRQFNLGDRVLVTDNGKVNEPGTVSMGYNGIYKDIQITGTTCYWIVFDKGEKFASASYKGVSDDIRYYAPCNVEVGHLTPM